MFEKIININNERREKIVSSIQNIEYFNEIFSIILIYCSLISINNINNREKIRIMFEKIINIYNKRREKIFISIQNIENSNELFIFRSFKTR